MARLLYLTWKHAGTDPYRQFHCLEADYTHPLSPDRRRPPRFPSRVSKLVQGFAWAAEEDRNQELKLMAGRGGM